MKTENRLRMCPYCEGTIEWESTSCKFCGSQLKSLAKTAPAYESDGIASLYDPPYAPKKVRNERSHYNDTPRSQGSYDYEEEEGDEEEDETKVQEETSYIKALLMLTIGGQLFTLSWLLFFFSEHGRLILEWKSRFWFLYFIISLPLLYHGFKRLRE